MNYTLKRMKRKTLTVSIKDGAVTVKAPYGVGTQEIERFLAQKSDWIQKKLDEYEKKTAVLGDVLSYACVMYDGRKLPISLTPTVKRVAFDENRTKLLVPIKFAGERDKIKAIASFYKRTAEKELFARLAELSVYTGLKFESFKMTNARGKWGSCDGDCNLRLNWRLIMLGGALVDYVIIHELCHTVHHDHSRAFWAEVGKYYKKYKQAKKMLKDYSLLTCIYR